MVEKHGISQELLSFNYEATNIYKIEPDDFPKDKRENRKIDHCSIL